jgi:hypothetical protein
MLNKRRGNGRHELFGILTERPASLQYGFSRGRHLPRSPPWPACGSQRSSTASRSRRLSCGAYREGKFHTTPAAIALGHATGATVFFFQLAHHAVDDGRCFITVHGCASARVTALSLCISYAPSLSTIRHCRVRGIQIYHLGQQGPFSVRLQTV